MRIISGKYRGRKLFEVKSDNTRSTTDANKESLFNTIGQFFDGGLCLDLFAGSGALGVEAISRGIDECYFFDISDEALTVINKNISQININSQCHVYKKSYLDALEMLKNKEFDIIFLDPPFRMDIINSIIEKISNYNMLKEDGIIVCQTTKEIILADDIDKLYKYRENLRGNSRYAYYERK